MSQIIKGNLPITIWKKEQENAIDYRIYGTLAGTGVQTENLVTNTIQGVTINSTGKLASSSTYNASIAPITAGTTYTLLRDYNLTTGTTHYAFFANLPAKGSTSYDGNRNSTSQANVTFTAPITGYVVVLNREDKSTVVEGNIAIPYGYEIPLLLFTYKDTMPTVDNITALEQTTIEYTKVEIAADSVEYIYKKDVRVAVTGATTAEGFEVIKTGLVLWNSAEGVPSGELTLENAAIYDDIKTGGKAAVAYSARIADNGQGLLARGYVTISDGTNTYTKYTSKIVEATFYVLYIGDTKLGEEEYADFSEQKIYKKKPNLVNDIINNVYVTSSGVLSTNSSLNGVITPVEKDKVYTVLFATGGNMFCGFFEEYPVMGASTYNGERFTFKSEYYTFTAPITGYLVSSCSLSGIDPVVYEGEYPRVAPTDPPASLPAIQAYQGENTLSSSERCENVSLEFNEATFYAGNSITQVYTNNQLYDLIDPSFYSLIANSYDSTQTYEIDSCCIYNYCLYKCITAITIPEIFNPVKWQQVTLVDLFQGGA